MIRISYLVAAVTRLAITGLAITFLAITGLATTVLAATGPAVANEIKISTEQMTELGIEVTEVRPADRTFAVNATASVVIPPEGQFAVSTAQAGSVVRLHAAVGDSVEAGQLLAEIRSPDFVTVQREFMDAKSSASLATAQLQRDRQLFDEGIIAHRRLQETEMQSSLATARLDEYRQLLELGGLSTAQVDSLAADRKLLDVASIRAPFDGVVLELLAMTGDRLEELQPIYRIADLGSLWLDIQVAGENADVIKPGMQVLIEVLAENGSQTPTATITSVGHARNDRSQTITVRAEIEQTLDQPRVSLHPGQFVAVKIISDGQGRADLWSVPASAVIHKGQDAVVFVRSGNGFTPTEVVLLSVDGSLAFIEAQLDNTAQIAAVGVVALKALWSGELESAEAKPDAKGAGR